MDNQTDNARIDEIRNVIRKLKSWTKEQALAIDLFYRVFYPYDCEMDLEPYEPPTDVPQIIKDYFNNDVIIVTQPNLHISVINYVCRQLGIKV